MSSVLTDKDFDKAIQDGEKPVLVDFFATWCGPCVILGPILEKVADDFKDRITFLKVDIDSLALTSQKFGINQVPTVVLFKEGKPVDGFLGLKPEQDIREWLEKAVGESSVDELIKWSEDYALKSGFRLNSDGKIVKILAKGLLENEKKHGQKYCPCRRITGDKEADSKNVCPCSYHRGEIEKDGRCLCGLFIK